VSKAGGRKVRKWARQTARSAVPTSDEFAGLQTLYDFRIDGALNGRRVEV